MKISEVFPSKYLTAADLNGKPYTLTIKTVTLEEMQTHDSKKVNKPVAWFVGAQKGFVMNSTNAHIIAGLYGDDTDKWIGQRITIYPTKVKAFGSMQDAIRVKEEIPAQPKPVAQAVQAATQSDLDDDEDVADYEDPYGTGMNATIDPETGEIINGDVLFTKDEPSKGKQPGTLSPAQLTKLNVLGVDLHNKRWDAERPALVAEVSNGAKTSCKELSPDEASVLIKMLEADLKHARTNGKVTA